MVPKPLPRRMYRGDATGAAYNVRGVETFVPGHGAAATWGERVFCAGSARDDGKFIFRYTGR
jgi:hypothetical protein